MLGHLLDYGFLARQTAEQHVVIPALEKVVEANTLLSGVGFESGGLAAAHAVHNGLTALPETHHFMHGEKVNFGTLTRLALEDRPTEEINDIIAFCMSVGLPTTLEELDLGKASKDQLLTVAEAATVPVETIHNMPFAVTPEMVVAADAYTHAYRQQSGKQAAVVPHWRGDPIGTRGPPVQGARLQQEPSVRTRAEPANRTETTLARSWRLRVSRRWALLEVTETIDRSRSLVEPVRIC